MEEANKVFWWARFIFFSAVAVFFLEFGISQMFWAYRNQHPAEFLISFFSASFKMFCWFLFIL